jgi:hypothetical protein
MGPTGWVACPAVWHSGGMALKRILGTAVRHPLATTAAVAGVAKGTLTVVHRLVRRENPWSSADEVLASSPETPVASTTEQPAAEREPEVVLPDPLERDLPEPVVIEAVDDAPTAPASTDPEGHVELEEELVWTSESSGPPISE